jgi:MscS family membrane protein
MNPALVDSFIYISIGIIAAGIIHGVFIWLKKRAGQTETKMDDLLVHSLGKPLEILAFFIPLFLAIQHSIYLYPQYQWITDY